MKSIKKQIEEQRDGNNRFSPGPWAVGECIFDTYPGRGKDGEADIYAPLPNGKKLIIASTIGTERGTDENISNARLLAAAPELLQACITAELICRQQGYTPTAEILRMAIDKATKG